MNAGTDKLLREAYAAFQHGQLQRAHQLTTQFLQHQPNHPTAHALMGLIAFQAGNFDAALARHEHAATLEPKAAEHQCNIGFTLLELARFDDAITAFQRANTLAPALAVASAGLATAYERRGDHDGARSVIEPYRAHAATTDRMDAVLTSILLHDRAHEEVVSHMTSRRQAPIDDGPARRQSIMNLGRALEKLARYDDAFAAFSDGNQILARQFDAGSFDAKCARLRDAASAMPEELVSNETTDRLIFIVGMPRSGSTLIEQIIHAHPQAYGAGELPAMMRTLNQAPKHLGLTGTYPEIMPTLQQRHLDQLARQYVSALPASAANAARVVDKALPNFQHVPFILRLFPKATILHARRHPLDTCLSCFMHNLSPVQHAYTTSLESLGRYFEAYEELMAAWKTMSPDRIIDVQYEALVQDFDTEARRIVNTCGLAWDDACASFHTARRDVTTISYEQVRQPIYRSAIARHERYREHLAPLRSALGARINAYEASLLADGDETEITR
ncbi:MAG: sulfotransferase [Planctomycetota bacterium]